MDLHMEITLHSHMPAMWYPYGSYVVQPYSYDINATWQAYD